MIRSSKDKFFIIYIFDESSRRFLQREYFQAKMLCQIYQPQCIAFLHSVIFVKKLARPNKELLLVSSYNFTSSYIYIYKKLYAYIYTYKIDSCSTLLPIIDTQRLY